MSAGTALARLAYGSSYTDATSGKTQHSEAPYGGPTPTLPAPLDSESLHSAPLPTRLDSESLDLTPEISAAERNDSESSGQGAVGEVPFFSGARSVEADWPALEARLREVATAGVYTQGPLAAELERAIADYTGARHAIAVGNGSDAIVMLLTAAGIGPGDEVIVPAYTFFSTASSVVLVGAEPVLVDVLPGSYAMDPAAAEAAITSRTKAIMPVHLFSQMADMAPLKRLADRHDLVLLEDSAEGIGMFQGGVHAGLVGTGGVLSFFPTKTLGALGDAGMVLTNDDEVAATVRRLRCHGQGVDGSYEYLDLGWNSRLDEVQAAVLLTRLAHLDSDIFWRAHLAALYDARLGGLPGVRTPWVAPTEDAGNAVYYVYLVELADRQARDGLVTFLADHGVGTEVYYPRPLTRQPALAGRSGNRYDAPVAEAASGRAVALPLYADLTDAEVHHVCDLVAAFLGATPSGSTPDHSNHVHTPAHALEESR